MTRTALSSALSLASLFLLTSCNETRRDIALTPEMMTRVEAFLEEMPQIADSLPKETKQPAGTLNPQPVFGAGALQSNVIVSSVEQLRRMDSPMGIGENDELRFYYGNRFAEWLSDRYASEPAPRTYEAELNARLSSRYVVAIKVLRFDMPELIDDTTFSGGGADVRFGLYDRVDQEWIGVWEVSAEPPSSISFEGKEHQFDQNMQFHVRQPVRVEIVAEMKDLLEEATGGEFGF